MHKALVTQDQLQVEVFRILGSLLLKELKPGREILSIAVESGRAPLVEREFLPVNQGFTQKPGSVAVLTDCLK